MEATMSETKKIWDEGYAAGKAGEPMEVNNHKGAAWSTWVAGWEEATMGKRFVCRVCGKPIEGTAAFDPAGTTDKPSYVHADCWRNAELELVRSRADDARLAKHAPELLAALKSLLGAIVTEGPIVQRVEAMRRATDVIARSEGK